ncbi:MAG TPA: proton-conducting transporter membrane subunit [Verrucomicrobiae bacterium]|nr:proton-conducting transporter membrane subunit [Verrucomicrobiae bacterium]
MFVGCLAYRSQDLKTILAFTTVSQISYVMGALIVGDFLAQKYATIYLILYCMQIFGFIAIFVILQNKYNFTNLNQLFLIKKYNKIHYYIIFSIIISLAGVPPFAGFFTKYFVFISMYNSGQLVIAIAGLLSSFFIAIIYLQIALQLMYVKPTHREALIPEHSKQENISIVVTNEGISIIRIVNVALVIIFVTNLTFFLLFPFI